MVAMQMMSALAQPTRFKVFTILARKQPDGLSAGEIAALSNTPATTMSAHLAILSRAGLVTFEKKGRTVTYTACRNAVEDLCSLLMQECG